MYKRQLTDRDEKANELFNEQVDIVNRIAKTYTAANDDSRPTVACFYITSNGPVTYTHLDVYKRQLLFRSIIVFIIVF